MTAAKYKIVVEQHEDGFVAYPLGFAGCVVGQGIVREREHIAMVRCNSDGTKTPLTLPNHKTIKSSTLRIICRQSAISREDFLKAYEGS